MPIAALKEWAVAVKALREGRQILLDAGIPEDVLISRPTMLDAARTAVAIANGTN